MAETLGTIVAIGGAMGWGRFGGGIQWRGVRGYMAKRRQWRKVRNRMARYSRRRNRA
jgi:hypothetical protein